MKSLFFTFCFLISTICLARYDEVKIKTPVQTEVLVMRHLPTVTGHSPAVIVASGRSCNSKRWDFFSSFGDAASESGLAVFRFEWSYCDFPEGDPRRAPSKGGVREKAEYQAVLEFAKNQATVDPRKVFIAGKSMGTMLAHQVFMDNSSAGLMLLTPICSEVYDQNDKPLPAPINIGEEVYPLLKTAKSPVLFVVGEKDDACVLQNLYDFLKDSHRNISVVVVGGGHGFELEDQVSTVRNHDVAAKAAINWMLLNSK